jgi:tungstate transport system ATP-binding protein
MSSKMVLLEVSNLKVFRGGVRVLDIPSFSLSENEVLALIGPNGVGKSSLLLSLARLLPFNQGELRYRTEPIKADRQMLAYRRRIAMVFQESLLLDTTVFHNVAIGLKIRGIHGTELRNRIMETLERFRISPLAERSARKLSGGEAQRVSLARAFVIQPELILLDEPFVSLDPPTRRDIMDDLARILAETSTAAILATHDQYEAVRLSTTIAVMDRGEIIQSGATAEVLNNPSNNFTASFVEMRNLLNDATGRQSVPAADRASDSVP